MAESVPPHDQYIDGVATRRPTTHTQSKAEILIEVPNVHSSKNGEHSLPLLRLSFCLRPYLKQVFFTLQSQSQLYMAQIDSRNSNIFQLIRSHQLDFLKKLLGYLLLRRFVRFFTVSASIATPQSQTTTTNSICFTYVWSQKTKSQVGVQSLVYGYVSFKSKKEAEAALISVQGKVLALFIIPLDSISRGFHNLFEVCSEEMVIGGCMVLTILGSVLNNNPKHILEIEGIIEEKSVDNFNVPMYSPTAKEVREVIEEEGSFWLEKLEVYEIAWDDDTNNINNNIDDDDIIDHKLLNRGKFVCGYMRAVMEPMSKQFGESVMDDLFHRFTQKVIQSLANENWNHTPSLNPRSGAKVSESELESGFRAGSRSKSRSRPKGPESKVQVLIEVWGQVWSQSRARSGSELRYGVGSGPGPGLRLGLGLSLGQDLWSKVRGPVTGVRSWVRGYVKAGFGF
ncbi:hypothetical protein F8388_024185 [Cannabis sativa]|uniref:Uncharacterized protein n=1 Tax=Cannabis sativa TaxID=3483 RepID=A0A7J6FXQ6_CANSA|nr:hypothetical protein F8388_024185 [Cannabis sativa]